MASREYTAEEIKAELIDHLQYSTASFWDILERKKPFSECLSGVGFSFLVALDGGAGGLPSFVVVPEGANKDIGGALHEIYHNVNLDTYDRKHEADLVRYVRERVAFWGKKADEMTLGQAINNLIIDLLSAFDGKVEGMPKYAISTVGSEEDKQDYIEQGMNYYPINTDEQIAAGNIAANISGDLSDIYKLAITPLSFEIVDGLELAKFELTRASYTERDSSKIFVAANLPLVISERLENFLSKKGHALIAIEGDAKVGISGNVVIKKLQEDGKASYHLLKQDLLNLDAGVDSPQLGKGERGVARESMNLPI